MKRHRSKKNVRAFEYNKVNFWFEYNKVNFWFEYNKVNFGFDSCSVSMQRLVVYTCEGLYPVRVSNVRVLTIYII